MALNSYSSLCDDFYLDMYIYTELDLPMQRDTILSFFERIQKQFPSMSHFYRPRNNQYCLEEDTDPGRYRWIMLEIDRIGSGVVNPGGFEQAYCQDRLVLGLVPYMLSVSHLDIAFVDVTFAMDFDCGCSHDEVIAEALSSQSAFNCLVNPPHSRAIGFSPVMVVSLSDDEHTQARISVESKTGVLEGRKHRYRSDQAISLSLTVRQYPKTTERFDSLRSFEDQCRLAEELMGGKIIPNMVVPLAETIAEKRLM